MCFKFDTSSPAGVEGKPNCIRWRKSESTSINHILKRCLHVTNLVRISGHTPKKWIHHNNYLGLPHIYIYVVMVVQWHIVTSTHGFRYQAFGAKIQAYPNRGTLQVHVQTYMHAYRHKRYVHTLTCISIHRLHNYMILCIHDFELCNTMQTCTNMHIY